MGPKSKATKKPIDNKQVQKVVEDKTFGIKNKKGAKQQKFIQHVQQNVQGQGKSAKEIQKLQEEKERKKLEKLKRQEELKSLFKPVIDQKHLDKGVDPKSVMCAYFKQGLCKKGDKCKFSHDLSKSRQSEKKSIYFDVRTEETKNEVFTNKEDLDEMVSKKHGVSNRANATSIVCKYFIEALENRTYGWFWECPNGNDKCMYRHCLPEGYVLKSSLNKAVADGTNEEHSATLEELIEKERAQLMARDQKRTPVTLATFVAWKKKKLAEKKLKLEKENAKRQQQFKQGRMNGLTGRDMFNFDPTLVRAIGANDSDTDDDDIDYNKRDDDEQLDAVEIDLSNFMITDDAIDESLFNEDEIADFPDS